MLGQVIVRKLTSRVLLICDATHALPIQVLRNDIRVTFRRTKMDDLSEHLPANTDIRVGDVLVTSDLRAFPGRAVIPPSSWTLSALYRHSGTSNRVGLQRLRYSPLLGSRS